MILLGKKQASKAKGTRIRKNEKNSVNDPRTKDPGPKNNTPPKAYQKVTIQLPSW